MCMYECVYVYTYGCTYVYVCTHIQTQFHRKINEKQQKKKINQTYWEGL